MEFKQFSFAEDQRLPVALWRQTSVWGYTLSCPTTVPVTVVTRDDTQVAVMVGWAVIGDMALVSDGALNIGEASLDDLRSNACGRFVLICRESEGKISVSTDAAGLFPIVFDQELGIVASSPMVIGKFRALALDDDVARDVVRSDGTTWYPFGLTPYKKVRRLLPSQALWLSSGKLTVRPRPPLKALDGKAPTASEICALVAAYVRSWASCGRLVAHLTAGFDSRMVMAAICKAGVNADYITLKGRGNSTNLDIHIAKRLATSIQASHRTLDYFQPSADDLSSWQERVGYCISDSVMDLCKTVQETDDQRITLTGACGEVGRAFYWTEGDLHKSGIASQDLLQRLGFQASPLLIDEADRWLARFAPDSSRTYILDNAYIDIRLACWAGPSMPGHLIPRPTISPFNSVLIYRAMLSIEDESRYSQSFPQEFIRAGSPKLLEEGFNVASGFSRIRFLRQEVKKIIPKPLRSVVKALLRKR